MSLSGDPLASALLDASPEPSYACDREGRILRANDAFAALVGAGGKAASLAGRAIADVAPHLAARFSAAHEAVLRSGEPIRGVETFAGPTGSVRRFEVVRYPVAEGRRRRPTLVAGLLREVAGRERAARAPDRASRSCEFVDSNMLPLVFWNMDGRITEANDAFLGLVGYTRADLEAGRVRWTAMTPPEYRAVEARALLEIARTGVCAPFEKEYIRKDGTRVPILIGGALLPGSRGEGVCFALDFTERHKLEGQLHQLQKMETIGRIAGGVAHDFGTLVSAIRMYARAALKSSPADDGRRADLEQIVIAADHALALSRRLLTFSRGAVTSTRVLNVGDILHNLDPLLRPLLGRPIELTIRGGAARADIVGDQGHLEQILLNLAVNARDAMPAGGRLTIDTSNVEVDLDQSRARSLPRPGTYLRLSVTDTGVGMTPDVKARCFEPYFTTKPEGKGTGLGLFTVYGLVRQGGGDIRVTTEPGAGTTFELLLPCLAEVANGRASAAAGRSILLVEPDETVATPARKILEAYAHDVRVVPSAKEAGAFLDAEPAIAHVVAGATLRPSAVKALKKVMKGRAGTKLIHVGAEACEASVDAFVREVNAVIKASSEAPDRKARGKRAGA